MMEKDSYETYEYVPDENDVDQFFLVQDDGTVLSLNNSQVQYMTQGQDVKELVNNVEPGTMYDITSPQFLIDANNAAEVISMPDQLMLPNDENIIISNNYLLPVANSNEEQIVQQDEVQYEEPEKHIKEEVENEMQKSLDHCTEITLSDEQFHLLEQKGWILLETIDKIYVLDTLGLHDITNNHKLIQKLKSSEASNDFIQEETSLPSQQDNMELEICEDGVKLCQDFENHDSFLMNSNRDQYGESMETSNLDTTNERNSKVEILETQNNVNASQNTKESIFDINDDQNFKQETVVKNRKVNSKFKNALKTPKTRNVMFRVSTNIAFKDIPDKIALGETTSGKKLFAKITKINNIDKSRKNNAPQFVKGVLSNKTVSNDNKKKKINSMSVDEQLFENLISQARGRGEVRCGPLDVASAHTTVMQLLKIPDFKASVFDRNLIITKVVSIQDEQGAYSSGGQPSLVTGRVTADAGQHCFVHVPDMLHKIINTQEDSKSDKTDQTFMNNYVLHVHVNEVKRADNVLRVSITLNTRKLSLKNKSEENKRMLPGKAFACRSCAKIFNNEDDLKQHQQTECLDVEGDLSMDLDANVPGYTTIVESGKLKIYHCNQCKMSFVKLHNCLKHLKTHYNSEIIKNNDTKDSPKTETPVANMKGVHKCKMCPCTFNHQQTLVKHILNKHIKKNIKV